MIELNMVNDDKLEVMVDARFNKLIEDIITSEKITTKKRWESKHNHYVIYEYEPFFIEGFNIIYELYDKDTNKLKFIQMILSNLNNNILMLERIFKGEQLITETQEDD